MNRKLVLLPGSFSPASRGSRATYEWLARSAGSFGLDVTLVTYPGQGPTSRRELTFDGAVSRARAVAERNSPAIVVGYSLGCHVACGLLAGRGRRPWAPLILVLFGPYLQETYRRRWGSLEQQRSEKERHIEAGTRLASNYFSTHPSLEALVEAMELGPQTREVRLVRGTADVLNSSADLARLSRLLELRMARPGAVTRFEIERLGHVPRFAAEDRNPQSRGLAQALFALPGEEPPA